ncbi:MAG: TIGR02587 family membrane protein [Cyanobacteriota bacterium]|nr:TIGR02587 family membrane protein [Cyanobacteriota bacterium]
MSRQTNQSSDKNYWVKEVNDLVRGASGGFLFGIPLLYTMEVWAIGSYVTPPLMLSILGVTYVVVFLFNSVEGFRIEKCDTIADVALESIEAMAIGLVCVTILLILLQRITWETPLNEGLGKVIFESVPFALGVSIARSLLSDEKTKNTHSKQKNRGNSHKNHNNRENISNYDETLSDVSATFVGAIIIGFSLAPTDEVTILAVTASPPWLLAIMLVSLLISYCIVFAAGFTKQNKRQQQRGLFQTPGSETIFSYLISLLVSVLMLWFFQKLNFSDPWFLWLRLTMLLGLPATIGGAAGRLAV